MQPVDLPVDRAFLWTLLTCATTLILVPACMRFAHLIGAIDHPNRNNRALHREAVPRIGGLAIAIAFSAACLTQHGHLSGNPWFLAGMGLLIVAGLIDDSQGLKPWIKLTTHAIAMAMAVAGASLVIEPIPIPLVGGVAIDNHWVCVGLTIFVGMGMINALNLIDGLDGLAAGISLIAVGGIAILAALQGNNDLCLQAVALAGCLIGLLGYNTHPARVYLGDAGSMVLGYLLACLGFDLVLFPPPAGMPRYSPFLPLLLLVVPWADSVWVMTSRLFRRSHPFAADRSHVHHQVLGLGLRHRYAVLLLLGASILIGAVTLGMRHRDDDVIFLTILCTMQTVVGGIRYLARIRAADLPGLVSSRWHRKEGPSAESTGGSAVGHPRVGNILGVLMCTSTCSLLLLCALSGLRQSTILAQGGCCLLLTLGMTFVFTRSLRHHFNFFLLFAIASYLSMCAGVWIMRQPDDLPLIYLVRLLLLIAFVSAFIQLWIGNRLTNLISTPLELCLLTVAIGIIVMANGRTVFNVTEVTASSVVFYVVLKAAFLEDHPGHRLVIMAPIAVLAVFLALQTFVTWLP